ncbi:guanine nucleotide-binding protein-like 1 isoform X3 [Hemicordylus capensis]|uniref:guanine nucleotide-binding protein-like 1 isoform X3 n=1 Tax=Hemicordylus capensis TaxID=884348 RepID=UPI0023044919|nr:guanine nucleotide-binding protein-like 1 isoform X3 [Hemicordylus capensis]
MTLSQSLSLSLAYRSGLFCGQNWKGDNHLLCSQCIGRKGFQDGVRSSSNSRSGSHDRHEDHTDTSDSESFSLQVRKLNQQPQIRKPGEHGYDPNRYRLHFDRESREEVERRKKIAREKILEPMPEAEMEVDIEDIYKTGSVLDFPRRPPWNYQMTKEQLLVREEKCFREYLENIYSTFQPKQLSYFEHNLETWRQLWRVLEMSDIVLLITDIRHPVINFSPALYDFVTKQMKRSLILVLNKIDLAPPALVVAWKHYFKSRFPDVHVVCFTSYPQQDQDPSAVFKKRRKRRKGWSTAMGPEQLLNACRSITAGNVDLSSWKEKIERDAASAHLPLEDSEDSEEEEDEEEAAVLVEHHSDVAMEPGGPSHELYKDGVLTVGCVGFPNVGKSSLINGLVGHKVVSVSRTPGHTKYFQTYFLTPTVKLCDCPGLIFPSLVVRQQQILAGIYPISQIQEPYTSVGHMAVRIPIQALLKLKHPDVEHGKPEPPWCAWDICEAWAEKRGYKTAKGARNDVYRAANSLLRLAVDGRLCVCMRPPGYTSKKAMWEHHPETAEVAALQEAHRHDSKRSSGEEEEEEEDEISSSGEEEDDEKDRDADEEGEEEEPLSAPKSGPSQPVPSRKGKLAGQNLFALLGEDEC